MKVVGGIVLLIAVAVGGMAIARVHVVRDGSGLAQLLWHDDEAFLFLTTGRAGWNVGYLWFHLSRLSLYGASPTDSRPGMVVFRLTRDAIEKREFDGARVPDLIAFDGAVSSGGARWTGERFDTSELRPVPDAFAGAPPQQFTNVGGWSKRSFFVTTSPTQTIDFELGGQAARLRLSARSESESIDLERPGRAAERIWMADRGAREIGSVEYDEIFK